MESHSSNLPFAGFGAIGGHPEAIEPIDENSVFLTRTPESRGSSWHYQLLTDLTDNVGDLRCGEVRVPGFIDFQHSGRFSFDTAMASPSAHFLASTS